jgi:hypothetical protein
MRGKSKLEIPVQEAADSVYGALRGLPWHPYLAAMWIMGGELQSIYAGEFVDSEDGLITATLNIVREALISYDSKEEVNAAAALTSRAVALEDAWRQLRASREDDATTGLVYAWATFTALTQEISGSAGDDGHDDAVEFVTDAVIERWPTEADQEGPIWVNDPTAAVAANSPAARTLKLFERVAMEAASARGSDWDLAAFRAQIYGDGK